MGRSHLIREYRRLVFGGLVLAGCSGRADERLLHQAGIRAALTCLDAEGIDRTSFCGGTFSTAEAEAASKTFALQLLERPEKHGKVTNFMNLPFECRVLLFDNPRAMDLTGVFDAPHALHEPTSGQQYASVVLARDDSSGQSCFTLVRDFH